MAFETSSFEYLLPGAEVIVIEEGAPSTDSLLTLPLAFGEPAPSVDYVELMISQVLEESAPSTDSVVPSETVIALEGAPSTDDLVTSFSRTLVLEEGAPSLDFAAQYNPASVQFGISINVRAIREDQAGIKIPVHTLLESMVGSLICIGAPLLVPVTSLSGGNSQNSTTVVSGQNPTHPIVATNGSFIAPGDGTFTPPSLTGTGVLVLYSIGSLFSF